MTLDPIRMSWRDYLRRRCVFHGRAVFLPAQQMDLLAVLLMRRGRSVSIGDLIEALWPDPDLEPDNALNQIRVLIYRLRDKLPGLIELWGGRRSGFGYFIDIPREEMRLAA